MSNTKYLKSIFFSSIFISSIAAQSIPNQTIIDEVHGYKYVDISKTDVNRIYCENGEFTQVIFSSEKEIDIQKNGKNAFVKLVPINKTQGDEILSTTINTFSREAYLTCDNKMFSLIFVPKDLPAQTVVLKTSSSQKLTKNPKKIEIVNDYQANIANLIKSIYKENTPEGYDFDFIDKVKYEFNELNIIEFKVYNNSTFIAKEYIIKANTDVNLNEKMFLPYLNSPLAIALEHHKLTKDSTTRMFVISNANPSSDVLENSEKFSNAIEQIKLKNQKEVLDNSKKFISNEVIRFVEQGIDKSDKKILINEE